LGMTASQMSNLEDAFLYVDWQMFSCVVRKIIRWAEVMISQGKHPYIENHNNEANRPFGLGLTGFFDAIQKLNLSISEDLLEIRAFNIVVFSCIYYNSLLESVSLAREMGPTEVFQDILFSKGLFQFDLWREEAEEKRRCCYPYEDILLQPEPNVWGQDGSWSSLREDVVKYGTRNSLLTAVMPNATTSIISDSSENVDGYQGNRIARVSSSGVYTLDNNNLVNDIIELGLSPKYAASLLGNLPHDGSIRDVEIFGVPEETLLFLKGKYLTTWEIPQKTFYILAAERGPFLDQGQSLSLYVEDLDPNKIYKALHFAFVRGLKTMVYYIRHLKTEIPLPCKGCQ